MAKVSLKLNILQTIDAAMLRLVILQGIGLFSEKKGKDLFFKHMFIIFATTFQETMARLKKNRVIQMAPHFCGFNPQGVQCKPGDIVSITFEEYEALNLCDYELLTQAEAAKLMRVSRPTFTRIYESVRRKIAKAFVEGCCIQFEEGNSEVVSWYRCDACGITFTLPDARNKVCPLCKSELITENKPAL